MKQFAILVLLVHVVVELFARADATYVLPPDPIMNGPNNTFAVAGSNAVLICRFSRGNCAAMAWYKYKKPGSNRVPIYGPDTGVLRKDKYAVGTTAEGCELTVKNVDLDDAGGFMCESVFQGKPFTGTGILIVYTSD